jgi:glycosyltransferase involved in cell wall biosynthesis
MRILLVAHGVTDQSLLGGPGRIAAAQANALTANGHDVVVVTTNVTGKGRRTSSPTFRLLDSRVSVRWVPGWTSRFWPGTIGPVFHPRSKSVLAVAIASIDVVHCHEWPHRLVQEARRIARDNGKPCFIQPHGSIQPRSGPKGLMHRAFARKYPPKPGEVFLVGSTAEEVEVRSALGKVNVRHVLNPMSLPAIDAGAREIVAVRQAWNFPAGSTVLLYAHRIFPNKGLDLLIRALVALPSSVHLAVVGPIGHRAFAAECERLATGLGLGSRVGFFGPVAGEQMSTVLFAADIFVLPARRDTFPMSVLEAMACGRPVVVTNTCQSVELLRDSVEIAEPTPDGLARAITCLLDPAERRSLGEKARELIRTEFGPATVAKQLEHSYASAQ